MNSISIFNFNQSQVRVEIHNDEPYFCLSDVTSILHINRRSTDTFRLNEKGCKKIATLTNGGKQELTFINEPNLYRVIFRSNKPEAVKFQDWIFEEVIPQIRKTGSYSGSLKSQTTTDQRTPLRQAVSALVGARGIDYSTAYKMVHQRFGVAAIEEIPVDLLPAAVEYVHRLTVGALSDDVLRLVASLLRHLPYQMAYFRATEKAVFSLCPELVFKTHDRFQDGIIQARQLADKLGLDFVPWREIRLV
jgi:hypothetical protein